MGYYFFLYAWKLNGSRFGVQGSRVKDKEGFKDPKSSLNS
jgi:hypothetical protein